MHGDNRKDEDEGYDYQSLFFLIGEHLPDGAERPVPADGNVLKAQARRLGCDALPQQLSLFLRELGSGEFRFGSVFSPVPDDDDGLSELDRELQDFRDSPTAERLLRQRSAEPFELLPFARSRLGTVYLFNLRDSARPNRLWTWESGDAVGEDGSLAEGPETFWGFLRGRYKELKTQEQR